MTTFPNWRESGSRNFTSPIMLSTPQRRDYYADHACPGYAFRAISFETLGRFSAGAMQSSAKPPTPPFSTPGTSVTPALPMCTANCLWCSVATCPACLPMLLASTPPTRVLAGSVAHRRPLLRFRTRHAGAAVGFISVGRRLGSDYVLVIVVGFCSMVTRNPCSFVSVTLLSYRALRW
jgi:hypothetical protein